MFLWFHLPLFRPVVAMNHCLTTTQLLCFLPSSYCLTGTAIWTSRCLNLVCCYQIILSSLHTHYDTYTRTICLSHAFGFNPPLRYLNDQSLHDVRYNRFYLILHHCYYRQCCLLHLRVQSRSWYLPGLPSPPCRGNVD